MGKSHIIREFAQRCKTCATAREVGWEWFCDLKQELVDEDFICTSYHPDPVRHAAMEAEFHEITKDRCFIVKDGWMMTYGCKEVRQ